MHAEPSKAAEILVGVLIPPAAREHVVGDLHERYRGPVHYFFDVLQSVPFVISSCIRRATDPDVFLMEALGLYIAFLGAAMFVDRTMLLSQLALIRLAIPAVITLAVSTIAAAYADPRIKSPLRPIREAAIGVGFASISQVMLTTSHSMLAIPNNIMAAGDAISLLLIPTLRMLFSSTDRPQGAAANGRLVWHNPVTRLMEYFGFTIVAGGLGAIVLFIVLLFNHNR